ncbi:MAG: P-II family nitrogen regulator [Christensenellaceae bacterium]|nr:P-II family nitrogen regulator [Christensenellaceae bacterium]
MFDISLVLTITDRALCEEFIQFYKEHGVSVVLASFGKGTATKETLDLLGLEEVEKGILFSVAQGENIKPIIKGLKRDLQIGVPGRGIVLTLPISSVGGLTAIKMLTDGHETERMEDPMAEETPFVLIMVIANEGYTDLVVNAAKMGGATGGTVIHARGIGLEEKKKFFGVSISDEKEIVFIVCQHACKNQIMKSVIAEAGFNSKAQSIVLSLPVLSANGLWALDHAADE